MITDTKASNEGGFTLVELSIVLVILGLLIGGVLTGQSLIRAAELRSVSTQFNQYMTATQTFRDKYFALPGDMTNAQSYWGVAHATPADCVTTASTTPATCNGDGSGGLSLVAGSNERFRFWQHLANAGLIEGQYDGVSAHVSGNASIKSNSPQGRLGNSSLWFATNIGNQSANSAVFDGVYGNIFQFGGFTVNTDNYTPVLKPDEAYNIDMKTDDGKSGTGRVVMRQTAAWGNSSSCSEGTASTDIGANYRLANSVVACALVFRNLF